MGKGLYFQNIQRKKIRKNNIESSIEPPTAKSYFSASGRFYHSGSQLRERPIQIYVFALCRESERICIRRKFVLSGFELSRLHCNNDPRHVAWHLLHIQAGNDNYINVSAHMHASQAQVEGCRSYQFGGGVRPYLISGPVTRQSCTLCRLTFVLFWCYL